MEELEKVLARIDSIFKIEEILQEKINKDFIQGYYKGYHKYGNAVYKIFQAKESHVHTALNFGGEFHKDGYYVQPKFIDDFIKEDGRIQDVIELGCGRGFNSKYLATRHRDVSFWGIDLTPEFIRYANHENKKPTNLGFKLGDFHSLPMPDENYDLVFDVESVCHAKDVKTVLQEVHRVLRPGGFYVAFDGFKPPGFDILPTSLIMAAKISDIMMGVGKGQKIDEFMQAAQEAGFEVMQQEDITHAIVPSLLLFQESSKKYLKHKFLARLLLKLLPGHIIKNAIAGLLMPFTVKGKAQGYYRIVLKKN